MRRFVRKLRKGVESEVEAAGKRDEVDGRGLWRPERHKIRKGAPKQIEKKKTTAKYAGCIQVQGRGPERSNDTNFKLARWRTDKTHILNHGWPHKS